MKTDKGHIRSVGTDETVLVARLRDGDPEALQALYVGWRKPLYVFLTNITGSEQDADDITQDVFIKLWEKKETLDPSKGIRNFMFLIARQSAYKLIRKRYTRSGTPIQDENAWGNDSESDSQDVVIAKEIELLTEIAISRMPATQQKVYLMSYKDGLSNEEIAERMQISNGAVRVHISDARKRIRELLMVFIAAFLT